MAAHRPRATAYAGSEGEVQLRLGDSRLQTPIMSDQVREPARRDAASWRLLAAILGIGAALRILAYVSQRSLWLDEARLALNIASRPFGGLLQPLDYDQTAPPLFLWGEKVMTLVFGVNELALRFIPLAAGLIGLALMYPVARRALSPGGARFATAAFALSPTLIFYSNELKQYAVDLALTLLLVKVAQDFWESRSLGSWRRLVLAGALSLWLSATALFVLCGVALAALCDPVMRRAVGLKTLLKGGAVWALSFSLVYFGIYRAAAENPYLRRYWASSSLSPWAPGFPDVGWRQIRTTFWGVFLGHAGPIYAADWEYAWGHLTSTPLVVLGVLGTYFLLRNRPLWLAMLFLGPLLAVSGASVIRVYPIGLRVLLFAAPLLIVLVAAAIERLIGAIAPRFRRAAWLAVCLLMFTPPVTASIGDALLPTRPEHTRPLVQAWERLKISEPVYVYAAALPAWAFYTTDWSAPDTARLAFLSRIGTSQGASFENAPSRKRMVRSEGAGLTRVYKGWTEIYGVPTGMEWSAGHQLSRRIPDLCWADHEVRRIRQAASTGAWLFVTHVVGPELELLGRMDTLGGREAYRKEAAGSGLIRYQIGPAAPSYCWGSAVAASAAGAHSDH